MMHHDIRHVESITLYIRLESIDRLVNLGVSPGTLKVAEYERCIAELDRRGQRDVTTYYHERLAKVYGVSR